MSKTGYTWFDMLHIVTENIISETKSTSTIQVLTLTDKKQRAINKGKND